MAAPTMLPSGPTPSPGAYPSGTRRDPFFYGWRYVTRTREDGLTETEQVPLTEHDVLHPQEEDFIMANDAHQQNVNRIENVFRWRMADVPRGLALFDHRIDFQVRGLEPLRPDAIVLLHSAEWNSHEGTYPVRDMGATVLLVIEVTSPSTRETDLYKKVFVYGRVGVPLYIIADAVEGDNGYRLQLSEYRPSARGMERIELPDNRVWLPEPLNLWLTARGDQVAFQERDGTLIDNYPDVVAAAKTAAALAEQEKQRAEQEKQRAEQEKQRADEATRKLQELEAELRRLRGE